MSTDTINPEPIADDYEGFEDYWGVQETFKFVLPDGKQYFEIRPMDEGGKTQFQKKTNKGIRVNQRTQDAHLDMDPADERHTLIKESVVSWYIVQKDKDGSWSEYPCPTDKNLRVRSLTQLLDKFNPKAIQDLEHFIRMKNPWMQSEMTLEGVDEELERLQEVRRQIVEREAGEGVSANS